MKLFQWVVTSSDFFYIYKVEPKISDYIEHSKGSIPRKICFSFVLYMCVCVCISAYMGTQMYCS